MLKFVFFATQIADTRNESFEETITEAKTFWNMARIKTIVVKVCKEKNSPSCGKNGDICRRQDTRVTGERREKFRENLDKLLDISGSDGIEQIRREKKNTVLR